jgi:type II secretory pathway component PulM
MANENRNQQVTLGCGTLLLIALIVSLFSHPGVSGVESQLSDLRSEVRELKKAIDDQSAEIKTLRTKLEK